MKFIFLAFLICVSQQMMKRTAVCHQDMINTYGLTPYRKPVKLKFHLCPYMRTSCCSLYDQYEIFNRWNKDVKPRLERSYDEIGKKLILLEKMIKFIMKINWRKLLRRLKIRKSKRLHLYKILLMTYAQNLPKRISSAIYLQREVADYFMKLRSQFFCQICDGQNQFFFIPQKKKVVISVGSCHNLAANTVDYSFIMYRRIFMGLAKFSHILMQFSQDSIPQSLKLPALRKKVMSIMDCKIQKRPDGTIKNGCIRYCKYFTFNSISQEMEGDILFIDKSIHYIAKFIKENYTLMPQVDRILEQRDFIYNKEQEKILKVPKGFQDPYKKPVGMTEDDIKNIFKSNSLKETQESLEVFAKSYLSYYDPKLDFAKPDAWKVFNFRKFVQVDLENFNTSVNARGMDLFNQERQLARININKPIPQIVDQIKNTTADEIPNELLDEKLIAQLNQVDDKYLKNFHGDLFMDFNKDRMSESIGKQSIQKLKENKEAIQEKEKIELPPLTEEEKKVEQESFLQYIIGKAESFIHTAKDKSVSFPKDAKKYMQETIDDLQYGKRPTI